MADASTFFAIRVIHADSTSWSPITCPIYCNTFSIRPDNAVKIRTDQSDALTEDTIADGMQISFQVVHFNPGHRFTPGQIIGYVQSVGSSTDVHVQFAR